MCYNAQGVIKMKKKLFGTAILIILFGIISLGLIYREPKIAILCYHNISTQEEKNNFPQEKVWTIDIENFEEQLKYLQKNNYKTLTMNEFVEWKSGKLDLPFKSVLITFDDGFLSNYEYAFPLLKKYNMNATVFIVGNFIENGKNTWTGNLNDYMSRDILEKSKIEYPNIEFYSHSYNMHYQGAIEILSEKEIEEDIEKFNEFIENNNIYCYPFGAYNEKMLNALKDKEYKYSFIFGPTSEEYRKASRKDNELLIPRLNISSGMDITKFGLRLLMPF